MVTLLLTVNGVLRLIVCPLRLLSKRIVSPLAAVPRTARSEPGPLSLVFSTVKVLSTVLSSSTSSRGARQRTGDRLPAGP
jgi:hypothetical protein